MNKKVLWITQTAIVTALLIVLQATTAPLGNTLITGSLVNLVLIVGVMIGGLGCGATVAVISPIFAKLFGIGPLWTIVPIISVGNLVLVICWHFLAHRHFAAKTVVHTVTAIVAAVIKFATLYAGVVLIMVPFLLQLPEGQGINAKQAGIISPLFSFPQLFTALIGGGLAILVLPLLQKALRLEKKD